MRRTLALFLALATGAAPPRAAAQVRSAPSAITAATAVSPAAASVSALPAAAAPLSAPAVPAPLSAPVLAAAPAPALAAAPLAASLPVASPVAPAEAAKAAPALARLAASPDAGALFDGSVARAAAADGPALAPKPAAPGPRAERPRFLALGRFHKALIAGAVATSAAPMLWSAAPGAKLIYAGGVALALVVAVLDVSFIARYLRYRLAPPPASRRTNRWTSAAIGLAMGVMAGVAPVAFQGPLIERSSAWQDSGRAAADRSEMRAIPGAAMSDETMKVLSQNPVGRHVLDRLRDRGGVVRLPAFFLSNQPDSYARHDKILGTLEIPRGEVTGRGWTVEQFLKDPALQRRLVREMASTIAHELTHEEQARMSPFHREFWDRNVMEEEYEAFLVQHDYVHAQLAADPRADLRPVDLQRYESALDDVDAFLKAFDSNKSYAKNAHRDYPRWRAFRAETMRTWPAHRVEGYLLLARRAQDGKTANMYRLKAAAAAKQAGLPAPAAAE